MRELVYYVAVSIDGYIAGPDGEFDAFLVEGDHMDGINERFADTIPTDFAEALSIEQHGTVFDTVLMGWNTYQVGQVASPYRHLRQIVFSSSRTAQGERLEVTSENPVEVVRRLKSEQGASIWLCGGGALAASLRHEIDRVVIKRQPVLFGAGIPFMAPTAYEPSLWDVVEQRAYDSGVVFSELVRRPAQSEPK